MKPRQKPNRKHKQTYQLTVDTTYKIDRLFLIQEAQRTAKKTKAFKRAKLPCP